MNDAIHTEEYRGYRINIYYDTSPDSPREWSNLGTIVAWSRNYDLSDKAAPSTRTHDALDVLAMLMEERAFVMPLSFRDYGSSGAKFYVGDPVSFAPYLSGTVSDDCDDCDDRDDRDDREFVPTQVVERCLKDIQTDYRAFVGFIYASRETIRKEYGYADDESAEIFAKTLDTVRTVLEGEIETYEQYINGNVYGYVVEGEDGEEIDDGGSCWGFYPEGDGGYEYCLREAKSIVDEKIEQEESADREAERYMVL